MSANILILRGCSPRPLAHYLKGLGVFRLVAEQTDAKARAFWKDDVFHLVTRLDAQELTTFVANTFAITPFIAPWNGGSGFYPKDAKDGITAIERSRAPRLEAYRGAIRRAREQTTGRSERPEKDAKARLLAECARTWDEPALRWFGAAVALSSEGAGRYPALLGTGGNDGRLEFTNNAMQRIAEVLDLETGHALPGARELAHAALFGEPTRGLENSAVGQFLPGSAGGPNSAAGFDGASQLNPWDFILMLEGAIALRVASLRRLDGRELPQAAAPFAIRALPVAYATATTSDEEGGRGEQWFPLWSGPARYCELERVFAEARLTRGARRTEGALDAARAIAQQGTARGIDGFVRYGYIVRNGLSNLAVPLSQITATRVPQVRLLDQLDEWLDRFARASKEKNAPASIERASQAIQRAMFDVATREANTRAFGDLLETLGSAEDALVRSGRFTAAARLRPIPPLSHEWLVAADDGTPEFRLASVIGSLRGADGRGEPVRKHCAPLDPSSPRYPKFATTGDGLRHDADVVWQGHDLVDDLAAVVLRRTLGTEARRGGIPLCTSTYAPVGDVNAFVEGELDDARIHRLARGLMAVVPRPASAFGAGRPLPLFALFRLACLDASEASGHELPVGASASVDAQTLRLLSVGRLEDAARVASRRLVAMGMRPKFESVSGGGKLSRRLLAALALPISPAAVRAVRQTITRSTELTSETP